MEGMTRAQHYQRAQELLAGMDRRVDGGHVPGPEEGWRTALAQVHATLALAMPDVAGETQELVMELGPVLERPTPDPDVVVDRLLLALQELERQDSSDVESTSAVAAFIRRRVLGGEEGR